MITLILYLIFSYFFIIPEALRLSEEGKSHTAFIVFILAPFTMPVLLGYRTMGE